MNHILFVDDDPMVLRGLRRAFSELEESWTADCVNSGAEALQKLAGGHYDVLVTDMRMPGMNGAQLLAEVVQLRPQIVRIVLSGQADHELLVQCVNTAHHYFSKPCDPELLRTTVQRLFNLGQGVGDDRTRGLVNRLPLLPSRPEIYQRLLTAIAEPSTDLESLGRLVESDQGLTAKVLKLANSSFFGFGHSVRSVADAVSLLGVEVLKSMVLSVQVFDFCKHSTRAGLSIERLWARAHSRSIDRPARVECLQKSNTCTLSTIDFNTSTPSRLTASATLRTEWPKPKNEELANLRTLAVRPWSDSTSRPNDSKSVLGSAMAVSSRW
ncbi:MAG: HDOD domain-containing protein [Opitutus sp.]|nr:HDOD domain-containing protein [Opitutus sp.]